MPNSRHTSDIDSPSSNLAINRRRSSITEHSFHGIDTPGAKPGSVTHVSGTPCYLWLGSLKFQIRGLSTCASSPSFFSLKGPKELLLARACFSCHVLLEDA